MWTSGNSSRASRHLVQFAALIVSAVLVLACLPPASEEPAGAGPAGEEPAVESDLAEIERTGKLTMLCWPHQESNFVRRMVAELGEEGLQQFAGIDVEILRGFADSLGATLEIRPMKESFAELIPSLLAGDGHVIGSSLTITELRSKSIDFSNPYHFVEKVVIVPRGSKLASIVDFEGLTASVVTGSSHEEQLVGLEIPDLKLVHTNFTFENYTEVAEGRADFTLVDSGFIDRVMEENPDLAEAVETAFVFPQQDGYGFAVAPGSDLRLPLNAYLDKLEQSGELERIKARYIRDDSDR